MVTSLILVRGTLVFRNEVRESTIKTLSLSIHKTSSSRTYELKESCNRVWSIDLLNGRGKQIWLQCKKDISVKSMDFVSVRRTPIDRNIFGSMKNIFVICCKEWEMSIVSLDLTFKWDRTSTKVIYLKPKNWVSTPYPHKRNLCQSHPSSLCF